MRALLVSLPLVLPAWWILAASLTAEQRLFEGPVLAPLAPTLEHYRALFAERAFLVPLRNSIVVAAATTALAVTIGGLAAYALARLRFRGKAAIVALVLAVSMLPQVSLVPPLYLMLRAAGLINTYPGLVLPYLSFALPLTIWLLLAFFRQMPVELEEAAAIDGAGRLRVLREIVVPLALPGLAATAIVTFLYCWNEFLFALAFTLGPERQTVPVAIALFRGRYQVPWGQVLAAAVVASVPILVLVAAFQRRIIQGLTAGGVKK